MTFFKCNLLILSKYHSFGLLAFSKRQYRVVSLQIVEILSHSTAENKLSVTLLDSSELQPVASMLRNKELSV